LVNIQLEVSNKPRLITNWKVLKYPIGEGAIGSYPIGRNLKKLDPLRCR
jgi:hypothetical protein